MDTLSVIIELFVLSLAVAVFGGTALLTALEARTPRLALVNRKVGISPVDDTAHQVDGRAAEPANAAGAYSVSKAA